MGFIFVLFPFFNVFMQLSVFLTHIKSVCSPPTWTVNRTANPIGLPVLLQPHSSQEYSASSPWWGRHVCIRHPTELLFQEPKKRLQDELYTKDPNCYLKEVKRERNKTTSPKLRRLFGCLETLIWHVCNTTMTTALFWFNGRQWQSCILFLYVWNCPFNACEIQGFKPIINVYKKPIVYKTLKEGIKRYMALPRSSENTT